MHGYTDVLDGLQIQAVASRCGRNDNIISHWSNSEVSTLRYSFGDQTKCYKHWQIKLCDSQFYNT